MNDSPMNQPIIKQDLENLRRELTKELTGKLASKEEIKKLATKDELKKLELATKKEFAKQKEAFHRLSTIVLENQR